jgi:hypothetical protein
LSNYAHWKAKVVITVLKLEKSESNSQQTAAKVGVFIGCNHCFKTRKI